MKLGFREDKRAVSALVGAILLLAILIIALSSYQAVIVPNQNAQTEFDHNQQVEDEMVDFRNALLEARLDERERATSVTLGTRYQSRTIAVNPPPATGSLQSTLEDNITVRHDGDEFELIGNQFFEYTPSYSEYRDAGIIRYENTLVYHEFESANVELTGQRLVDGNTVRLVPSEPSFDENGVNRVTYEPKPSRFRVLRPDEAEITLPTKLEPGEWSTLLEDEDEWEVDDDTEGEITLEYVGEDAPRIVYSPVEDQENLPPDERDEDDEDDESPTVINPAGPDDVALVGVELRDPNNNKATLTFRNAAEEDDARIEGGRLPFYIRSPSDGQIPDRITGIEADGTDVIGNNWVVRSDFQDLNDSIIIPANAEKEIIIEFNEDINRGQDLFAIELRFETQERSTYFIG